MSDRPFSRILVTGGAGFIGSNFIYYLLERHPDVRVVNLDALTYAGNLENLKKIQGHPNYRFVRGQIQDRELIGRILTEEKVEAVVNFAAESHVDRSILGPEVFVETNVRGTLILLDEARRAKVQRFLQVSTDEVYGSLGPEGSFSESTPLAPNSPYSASKAGADFLVRAYHRTYGFPTLITRSSNNYGPYQFPEKLIPLMVLNALQDKRLPVYGDGMNVRDWIYVEDHCSALAAVLFRGEPGEIYNIGANCEKPNLEIVRAILAILGKPRSLIQFVQDRPGHDRRYSIDSSKIRRELAWSPCWEFEKGIARTVEWYLANGSWWERIISGDYKKYYETMYGGRFSA